MVRPRSRRSPPRLHKRSPRRHQDQSFALVLRQLVEGRAEFLELQMRVLRRLGLEGLGIAAVGILHLPPPLAVIRAEQVAQDREQPCRQVRAGLDESILASARSRVSWTRSSARSPLPESEIANARRLGTEARMSSRSESVRGISPSHRFYRPRFPLGGCPRANQASGSVPRTGPVPLAYDIVVHGPELVADSGLNLGIEPPGLP